MKTAMDSAMKKRLISNLLSLLVIATPLITALFLLIIGGASLNFKTLMPVWNDEVGWYSFIDDTIKYGMPLGYTGYNGTYAQIGNYGPWGISPIIPYAVFGKIFGWSLYSMPIANITFLSLGMASIIILGKPTNSQKIWMSVMYCCSFWTVSFSILSMSEGLRYSCGLFLVAVLLWMNRKFSSQNYKPTKKDMVMLCIFMLMTLYIITVYLILAIILPLFCWILFRKVRAVPRLGISIGLTAVIAAVLNKLTSLFCAPYVVSTMSNIRNQLAENGIIACLRYTIGVFLSNLDSMDLVNILGSNTYYVWFIVMYLAVVVSLFWNTYNIIYLYASAKVKKENSFLIISAFVICVGFAAGYCMLYTGYQATLSRGINTGFLMTLMLLVFADSDFIKKLTVSIFLLGSVSIMHYFVHTATTRADAAQHLDRLKEEIVTLESVMKVSPDSDDPWDNTVAIYGKMDYRHVAIPTGISENYFMNNKPNNKAKYAMFDTGNGRQEEYIKMLEESGYTLILNDDFFYIFQLYE